MKWWRVRQIWNTLSLVEPKCIILALKDRVKLWAFSLVQGVSELPARMNMPQRLASLTRFREKRKERCYDKKIRYTVRKEVAQRYIPACPWRCMNWLLVENIIFYRIGIWFSMKRHVVLVFIFWRGSLRIKKNWGQAECYQNNFFLLRCMWECLQDAAEERPICILEVYCRGECCYYQLGW